MVYLQTFTDKLADLVVCDPVPEDFLTAYDDHYKNLTTDEMGEGVMSSGNTH